MYNLGNLELREYGNASLLLMTTLRQRAEAMDDFIVECYEVFNSEDLGYEMPVLNHLGRRKTWQAFLKRESGGCLNCHIRTSLFGDVAAMSVASTLAIFNYVMRVIEPNWRILFVAGIGSMSYFYEEYGNRSIDLVAVAPTAAWETIIEASETLIDGHASP